MHCVLISVPVSSSLQFIMPLPHDRALCRLLDPSSLVPRGSPSVRGAPLPVPQMRSGKAPLPSACCLLGICRGVGIPSDSTPPFCLCCVQVGIEMKFKGMAYPVIIAPTHVPEMNQVGAGHVPPIPS